MVGVEQRGCVCVWMSGRGCVLMCVGVRVSVCVGVCGCEGGIVDCGYGCVCVCGVVRV